MRMKEIFEMTDEELAHIIRAAQASAVQDVIELVQKWVYSHSDLNVGGALRFSSDVNPHELLDMLWGERP